MNNKGYGALCDFIGGKKIALIGAGVSNIPLVAFLYECGAKKVTVRDLKKTLDDKEIKTALENGGFPILGEKYLDDLSEDIIIRSPGIRPDIPAFLNAIKNGSELTCEIELFLRFAPAKIFGITGSDGKTTTTTLISKLLSEEGYHVILGGNIGKSMLPQIKDIKPDKTVCVMELSSFQLMNCKYSPDVSVITNLSENHLDWHRDMAEYLEAKKNILAHQTKNGIAVLNFDNIHTKACSTKGEKRFFSRKPNPFDFNEKVSGIFVFCDENAIYVKNNETTEKILDICDILIPGKHNVENYMTAIGATFDFVSKESIQTVAKTFGGVEHRIELCRVLDGVRYYNSSIDSSPSRSTAALRAFDQKLIMIAGGYDKNLDYTGLGDEICERVKTLILCGATAEKIKTAVLESKKYQKGMPCIIECKTFEETVKAAKKVAEKNDVVILSPASASFDLFKNFEERGKLFKQLVSEL